MRCSHIRILLGGLVVLLAILACSFASPALPTLATLPPVQKPTSPALATAAPTLPAATASATPIAATVAPTVAPSALVSAPDIHLLDMLDNMNGWGVTVSGVVRTMDGGVSWYDASPTGLNGAPVTPFFLNSTTAWLAAMGADPTTGTLFHTSDGGASWSSVAVPFGGGSLKFVDPMNGWELVGLSAGMSHEAVSVYRTSDGGITWKGVFTDDPNTPGSSDSLPLVGDKNGITAQDTLHAWVTGAEPTSDLIYVYATQDGGSSWSLQHLAMPAGYGGAMTGPSQPVFFNQNQGVLPVFFFSNTNGTDFYISNDGGQSWSATTPVAQGGFVAVASASLFFVWDGSAPLYITHDSGTSWSSTTPNINIKDNMVSMQFVNTTTGWALTADANGHCMLYQTKDGGTTWKVLLP